MSIATHEAGIAKGPAAQPGGVSGAGSAITRPALAAEAAAELAKLQQMIASEDGRRRVLRDYLERNMKPQLHFYWLSERDRADGRKPSLSKDGAMNLAELYRCRIDPTREIEHEPGGHMTVVTRVRLVHRESGEVVATADGLCTTHESKYAYRWIFGSEAESLGIDKAVAPKRTIKTKRGDALQYRIPNEAIADQHNTVLKMSFKRAAVAASLLLPMVSELFTQDLEEQIEEKSRQVEGAEEVRPRTRKEIIAGIMAAGDRAKALGVDRAKMIERVEQQLGKKLETKKLSDEELGKVAAIVEQIVAEHEPEVDPFNGTHAETPVTEPTPGAGVPVEAVRPEEQAIASAPTISDAADRAEAERAAGPGPAETPEPAAFGLNRDHELAQLEATMAQVEDWGQITAVGWIFKNYGRPIKAMSAADLQDVREELEGLLMAGGFDPAAPVRRG